MGGGGKGSQTTQNQVQSQTYSAAPQIQGAANQALGQAQSAASQPFQMPVAPVAGFTPLQQQAFNQYQSIQGIQDPFNAQAANLYGQAGQAVDPNTVNQYYQPEISGVMSQLANIYGQQNSQNTGNLVQSAGGIGADRIAVGQAQMANQQDLAAGQTAANVYQSAVAQAQADKARQAGVASGLQGLGGASLTEGIQGTGALLSAGTQQQQQNQAQLNAPYQNQLAQLAYPFQTAQYLAGITGGLAPALGGTTFGNSNNVTTPPTPSIWNQLAGIGTAGVGLYGAMGGGGQSAAYGGGNAFTDAYGGNSANPLPGLDASDYGAGFAEGGEVDPAEGEEKANSIVPTIAMNPGAGHSGPMTGALNMQMPQQQQSQSGNSAGSDISNIIGTAAKVLPFLLKRGGYVPGYADAGGVDADLSPDEMGPSPLIDALSRNFNRFNSAQPPTANPYTPPATWNSPPVPVPSPDGVTAANAATNGQGVPSTSPWADQPPIPFPGANGQRPTPTIGGPPPPPSRRPVKAAPQAGAPSAGQPGSAGDSGVPDQQLPYPDALNRDWGQNMTRSPWMSLVNAGATIAATPGPLGSAIGKGILAGTKSLNDERTNLRSEQELNDKAKQLHQTAKAELDKYNKMTPYERASIAIKNRELDQSEGTGGVTPVKEIDIARVIDRMDRTLGGEWTTKPYAEKRNAAIGMIRSNQGQKQPNAAAGDSADSALADPGEGKRMKGKYYIGPSGQPQQWLGG